MLECFVIIATVIALARRTEISRRDNLVGSHSSRVHKAYGVESGFLVNPDGVVPRPHFVLPREGGPARLDLRIEKTATVRSEELTLEIHTFVIARFCIILK